MEEQREFLDLSKYEIVKEIARGNYGIVYTIQDKDTGVYYAAKVSKDGITTDNSLLINLKREVNLMSQLVHPAVLSFIGYSPIDFESNPNPVIVTEFSRRGSLEHIISLERQSKSPENWDDTQKLINIYGISSAMTYLHSNEIIHRDLKPENILESDTLFPLIADFGLSKESNSNTVQSTFGVKGTPYYIPPEVYDTGESTKKGDVYAFSMIVYELMTLEKPFNDFKGGYFDFINAVCGGDRPQFNKSVPERYKKLITDCWAQNPDDRPDFEAIVNQLKNDKEFLIDTIDKERFDDYVKKIENSKISFTRKKTFKNITLSASSEQNSSLSNSDMSENFLDLISLTVNVIEAKNLMQMNFSSNDDPFINLRLKSKNFDESFSTQTKKGTLNPVWNEKFFFVGVNPFDSLIISMYDNKIKACMMNEITLPISSIDESIDRKEFKIQYKNYKNAGNLFLGFKRSITKKGHIKIHVFDAKNLVKSGVIQIGKPSPLMSFGIKNLDSLQSKTNMYFENTDPVWNQNFVIEVPDINTNIFVISLFDNTNLVYEKEVQLRDVQIGKKNVFNEKILNGKKEIGIIHYGFELCSGYPKNSQNEKKIYAFHEKVIEKKNLFPFKINV